MSTKELDRLCAKHSVSLRSEMRQYILTGERSPALDANLQLPNYQACIREAISTLSRDYRNMLGNQRGNS